MNLSREQVIVQLLNPHEEGIVVHSGTKVAELEEVVSTVVTNVEGANSGADTCSANITVAKMELLHSLVEQATAPLTSKKKKDLFELMVEYHNVFATSVGELGCTHVLKSLSTWCTPRRPYPFANLFFAIPPAGKKRYTSC